MGASHRSTRDWTFDTSEVHLGVCKHCGARIGPHLDPAQTYRELILHVTHTHDDIPEVRRRMYNYEQE